MQTHNNLDHESLDFSSLEELSEKMYAEGESSITAGVEGEEALEEWVAHGVYVCRRPVEEIDANLGIARASVGGIYNGQPRYLVFRGRPAEVRKLLKDAIEALDSSHAQ